MNCNLYLMMELYILHAIGIKKRSIARSGGRRKTFAKE